ncbi:MAG: hypothetical protein AAFN50_06595 [Pseudomonadota bacterium]
MLTSFKLRDDITIDEFQSALNVLSAQLIDAGMLNSTGPIGRRQRHPVMDTEERDHEFYFIMSFDDRAQCDRSVEHIYSLGAHDDPAHVATYNKISDAVFVCWEDIE